MVLQDGCEQGVDQDCLRAATADSRQRKQEKHGSDDEQVPSSGQARRPTLDVRNRHNRAQAQVHGLAHGANLSHSVPYWRKLIQQTESG